MAKSKSIGFIGLGLMGVPMLGNLIKKSGSSTRFFVFDVDEDSVGRLCDEYSGLVERGQNARDVAEKAV